MHPQHPACASTAQINSKILTTKNKELAIFGQTLSEVKKKLIDFNDIWMQGGRFGSNKQQLIPEEKLTKELSFDEAKKMLDSFNQSVTNGKMKLDEYFAKFAENDDLLKTYVTTTDQQNQSVQGLVQASKNAREAQLKHNEAVKASTLAAKAQAAALKLSSIALNAAAMVVISKAISFAATTIDNHIHRVDNAKEALADSVSAFEQTKSEIEGLNDNLKTCGDRIVELQI